jgi:hypothetical protein
MGVHNPRYEELLRLESKTLDTQFLTNVQQGLNCSPFESFRRAVLFGIAALVGCIGVDAYSGSVRQAEAMTNEQTRSSLTVDLSLRMKKGEPILAHLQFTNRGSCIYELLSWLTFPTGRMDSKSYFSISVDGRPCRYIGIMKKRDNPTAADYIAVKPGESLTRVVSLSEAYAISGAGVLTVVYSAINPGLGKDRPGDPLVSGTVSARLN